MLIKSEILAGLTAAVLASGISLSLPTLARAADYKIDPAHSFIQFKVSHLGIGWVIGRFNTLEGEFTYDPAAGPSTQRVSVTIDPSSVDTNHAERDKDLRSARFLDVESFPTATFVSTGFDGNADGGTIIGDLSVHGVTKSISFPVVLNAEGEDPWGGYRAGFDATYTLVREDFGMTTDLGPKAQSFEVELYIEGVRQ